MDLMVQSFGDFYLFDTRAWFQCDRIFVLRSHVIALTELLCMRFCQQLFYLL